MSQFKFKKGQKVMPTRWLDIGAPKGVGSEEHGTVIGMTPAKDSGENRNYYTVRFPHRGTLEIAEDELRHDNALDYFVDQL